MFRFSRFLMVKQRKRIWFDFGYVILQACSREWYVFFLIWVKRLQYLNETNCKQKYQNRQVVPKCKQPTLIYITSHFPDLEEFEHTKRVIWFRKSKYRQRNGQSKRGNRRNNDLQNTTRKTTDQATRTPLKSVVNSGTPEG